LLVCLFFEVLGIEPRVVHLYSTTWITFPALLFVFYFWDKVLLIWPRLASNSSSHL
jgi:hypothetical protein